MKKKSIFVTARLFVAALLLCNYPASLMAQDSLSLIEKVERVTKEKEPQWELDRKLPSDKLVVLRWSSGAARVFMSITITDSPGKAQEIYESSEARLNEQLGTNATKSKVPDLGVQNQMWTGYVQDGSASIQFRQEKVHVLLMAPSEDVAKRFARHVADLLPTPSRTVQIGDSPQAWKEFSSVEGRFSILFSGDPTVETQVIDAAPGVQFKLRIHKVKSLAEHSVMYADYPIPVGDPAVAKSVLDNGAKGAVASVDSELLELKEITHDGHPGRYLKEKMPGKEIMRVKMLLVGQRLYQIAITTPREESASAETVKAYEAMANKFLNSFKLLK